MHWWRPGAFQTQIERGRAAGLIRTDVSAAVQATHLLLVFEGLLVLARSGAVDLMDSVDLSLACLSTGHGDDVERLSHA